MNPEEQQQSSLPLDFHIPKDFFFSKNVPKDSLYRTSKSGMF